MGPIHALIRLVTVATLVGLGSPAGPALAAGVQGAVTPIGSFGDLKLAHEHCLGQNMQLWKSEGEILGVVEICAGLEDTKRRIVIDHGRYDPRTGDIAFEFRFSLGSDYMGDGNQAPSRDDWTFHGRVRAGVLDGVLTKADLNFPKTRPQVDHIRLKPTGGPAPTFGTADDWRRWASQGQRPGHN